MKNEENARVWDLLGLGPFDTTIQAEDSPLEEWFKTVASKKLSELSAHDICRCLDQDVLRPLVVPIVVDALKTNPLAGELYDGHMIHSLGSMPRSFWEEHPAMRDELDGMISGWLANPAFMNEMLPEHRDDHIYNLKRLRSRFTPWGMP